MPPGQGIARRHEVSLNDSMKLGFLILLLSVSIAASKEIPNKSITLTWDASPISDKVTGYRVYELVKSRRFLIGQSKTTHLVLIGQSKTIHLVIPREKGETRLRGHGGKRERRKRAIRPLQVQN